MAEISFLDDAGGDSNGEPPYWSQDFDIFGPDSDPPSTEISATVEILRRENQVNFVMDLFHQRVENQSESIDSDFCLDVDLGLGFSNNGFHGFVSDLNGDRFDGFVSDSIDLGRRNGVIGTQNCDLNGDGFDGFVSDSDNLGSIGRRIGVISTQNGDGFDGFVSDSDNLGSIGRRNGVISTQNGDINGDGFDLGRRDAVISDMFCVESCDLGDISDVNGDGCDGFVYDSDEVRRDGVITESDEEIENMGVELDPFSEEENDDRSSVQICWDSFGLEDRLDRRDVGDDFEWEEIDGRVDQREVMSMFFDAEVDDDLDVSVAMEEELEELGFDQGRNLEWEFLLSIPGVDSNAEDDYEMLDGQFAGAGIHKPPASKAAVESLAVVVVTKGGDVDGEDACCAICKDDMGVGEKAKMLPCSHSYHVGCIEKWLGMKNTCPVCRYELPTDDCEYERAKVERERLGTI